MINPISASSDDKTEAYRLLVMVHTMGVRCARAKVDNWIIRSSCTDSDYISTVVSNGIIDVSAITINGRHTYSMRKIGGSND